MATDLNHSVQPYATENGISTDLNTVDVWTPAVNVPSKNGGKVWLMCVELLLNEASH